MAKLYFRYGAMNSGKSTALLQVANNYEERGLRVIIAKPKVDSKANDRVSSRLGIERKVDLLIGSSTDIYQEISKLNSKSPKISCVLVDESQFLTEAHVEQLLKLVVELNIAVICYGLRSDFRTVAFEGSSRLMSLAHSIEEMKTICSCGKKAIFNARFIGGEFTTDGDVVAIDGKKAVTYEGLCAGCYSKKVQTDK